MVLEGKPIFQYNFLGLQRHTIASSESLPKGECTIRFDFAYDGGGTGTLSINGKDVADGTSIRPSVGTYS
jgi:hypothetical protein